MAEETHFAPLCPVPFFLRPNVGVRLFFFCLFLNAVLSSKGVGRKIFWGKGAKGTPRSRNSTNKPPSVLSVAS